MKPKKHCITFFQVLKTSTSEPIRQLVLSPNDDLLAILTSHTVQIAILPKSSYLGQGYERMKLKTFTLGPTTHVLSQSPVVRALWHPCGIGGNCLVTVTSDSVVRIWELNCDNRSTFDSPSLGIDLKKLAFATSQEDDFAPYGMGRNREFSAATLGMEAVSACFGGTGSSEESAWSALTLWVAMREGDVYALCPLIPAKWQPSSTSIPSLSTIAVSRNAIYNDREVEGQAFLQSHLEQYEWISNIDKETPSMVPGANEISPWIETYSRPSYPGPVPELQGPFQIFPDKFEEEVELSDLHIIAAKLDRDDLLSGEDANSESEVSDADSLSTSIVCVLTKNGRLYLCLDVDGIEGKWLPSKKVSSTFIQSASDTSRNADGEQSSPFMDFPPRWGPRSWCC